MAEEKPVRKTVRKAATRKRVTKKVATKRTASASPASTTVRRRSGLSIKAVLIAALALIGSSAGAFYVGYSSDAEINVTALLADQSNYVNNDSGDIDNNEKPVPRANTFRPVLEVADRELGSKPEPAPNSEEMASSTDATASSTEDGTDTEIESETETNTDSDSDAEAETSDTSEDTEPDTSSESAVEETPAT